MIFSDYQYLFMWLRANKKTDKFEEALWSRGSAEFGGVYDYFRMAWGKSSRGSRGGGVFCVDLAGEPQIAWHGARQRKNRTLIWTLSKTSGQRPLRKRIVAVTLKMEHCEVKTYGFCSTQTSRSVSNVTCPGAFNPSLSDRSLEFRRILNLNGVLHSPGI